MSITPDLIPFTRLFVSDFVLKGGDVLKLLSKPCNSSSFNVKWCAETLQVTRKLNLEH